MQNPDDQQQARERFSKRLTQVEVEKRLILFPLTVVAGFFNFEVDRLFCMDVVDWFGKAWTFMGSIHSNYEDLGSVVSVSWPQFATEKGIKANDEVIFIGQPLDDDDDHRTPWKKYKVEVKRKIRLFGQDIWGDLKV
ncbi:hypothetical protein REPUB_Repub01dG0178000 [Reevesia pubescens]